MEKKEAMAKFLGWTQCDCGQEPKHYKYGPMHWQVYTIDALNFDTDWGLLMMVIDKIESLGYDTAICGVVIKGEKLSEVMISPQDREGKVEFHNRIDETKIKATFEIASEFITWWNLNKQ